MCVVVRKANTCPCGWPTYLHQLSTFCLTSGLRLHWVCKREICFVYYINNHYYNILDFSIVFCSSCVSVEWYCVCTVDHSSVLTVSYSYYSYNTATSYYTLRLSPGLESSFFIIINIIALFCFVLQFALATSRS